MIDRKGDVAGQFPQQFQLVLMEEFNLAGIEREYADRFIGDDQGENSHRANAEFNVPGPQGDPGIGLRIIGDNCSFFPDRLRRQGIAQRRIFCR